MQHRMLKEAPELHRWLEAHPQEALVRAALRRLAGYGGAREQAQRVSEDVGVWLSRPEHQRDHLPRAAWLWLVGYRGTQDEANRAISETAAWLAGHPEDCLLRVANLLFLVKRRGATSQIRAALESHGDDALARLALDYVAPTKGIGRGGKDWA